jgi:hypothetical protein
MTIQRTQARQHTVALGRWQHFRAVHTRLHQVIVEQRCVERCRKHLTLRQRRSSRSKQRMQRLWDGRVFIVHGCVGVHRRGVIDHGASLDPRGDRNRRHTNTQASEVKRRVCRHFPVRIRAIGRSNMILQHHHSTKEGEQEWSSVHKARASTHKETTMFVIRDEQQSLVPHRTAAQGFIHLTHIITLAYNSPRFQSNHKPPSSQLRLVKRHGPGVGLSLPFCT